VLFNLNGQHTYVHFSGLADESEGFFESKASAKIIMSTPDQFARPSYREEIQLHHHVPQSQIKYALLRLGRIIEAHELGAVPYNLVKSNCEHLARHIVHGEWRSKQVEKIEKRVDAVVKENQTSLTVMAMAGVGLICMFMFSRS